MAEAVINNDTSASLQDVTLTSILTDALKNEIIAVLCQVVTPKTFLQNVCRP